LFVTRSHSITSVIWSLSPEADMFAVDPFTARNHKKLSFLQEGIVMGQKLGNFALIAGGCFLLIGVSLFPAALAQRQQDESILGAGICAIAFGALSCAAGFYVKARALQRGSPAGFAPAKKSSGGCDLCRAEAPVIHCRVHHLHICAGCLTEHYDFRTCVYIPSTRRQTPQKPAARAAKA
jgi:hypothetical protein